MSIFKESNGKISSKRVVGILGLIATMSFVWFDKGTETLIIALIAAFTSMLVATAFSSNRIGGELPDDDDEHKK